LLKHRDFTHNPAGSCPEGRLSEGAVGVIVYNNYPSGRGNFARNGTIVKRQANAKEASQITPKMSPQALKFSEYIAPPFQNMKPSNKASNTTDIPK
jgi:hypothetical protein